MMSGMRWIRFPFLLVSFLICISLKAQEHPPIWSRDARMFDIFCEHHCDTQEVKSPDGRYSVGLDFADGGIGRVVVVEGERWIADLDFPDWTQIEVMWSPSSRAFSIMGNTSDFSTQTRIWVIEAGKLREVNAMRSIGTDTVRDSSLRNDAIAIAWRNANTLLVVAQKPCPGEQRRVICEARGYEVRIPSGEIVKTLTALELKLQWRTKIAWDFRLPASPNARK
jgi:hypothetical protein